MKSVITLKGINFCSCDNYVHKELAKLQGIFSVRINHQNCEIVVDHTDEIDVKQIEKIINELNNTL